MAAEPRKLRRPVTLKISLLNTSPATVTKRKTTITARNKKHHAVRIAAAASAASPSGTGLPLLPRGSRCDNENSESGRARHARPDSRPRRLPSRLVTATVPAMLLYDNDLSGNCYKVRLLFAQLGIEYETRELSVFDRADRPEVLGGLNPALRVPTLVLDDGRALAESNAILCYLADGTPLLPEDRFERAQVLQWLFFEQYSHEPFIAVARFWAHAGITPPDAEREARQRGGIVALEAVERHLADREYLVGGRYTIADIALYAYTHVAPEGGFQLEPYPAIRAWLERVRSQPGHVTIDARPHVG